GTSRRRFLFTMAAAAGGIVACAPATPAPPGAAPKPAEPTKPPAAAPTQPAAAPKPTEPAKPAAPEAGPKVHAPAGLKTVPRNRTLIYLGQGGIQGKYVDHELWNPYAVGANHQNGSNMYYEPVAYYSAFADKEHPWLVESYEYSPDFKTLTMKTRSGIQWSDGKPFSAEDIAYTLTALKDLGSKVRWGVDVQQFVDTATATD